MNTLQNYTPQDYKKNIYLDIEKIIANFDPLFHLMKMSDDQWDKRPTKNLEKKIDSFCQHYSPRNKTPDDIGFSEKHDLEPESSVVVIGKINEEYLDQINFILEQFQNDGTLDENFRCKKNKHVVFLNPPFNHPKALEMILTLKMENRDQVHLLSNYEIEQDELIIKIKDCLPKRVYLGVEGTKEKEYMQFNYDLSLIAQDPSPLLTKHLKFGIENKINFLHTKIANLYETDDQLNIPNINLANFIKFLSNEIDFSNANIGERFLCDNKQVKKIPADIVWDYLQMSNIPHKIHMIFLGQQCAPSRKDIIIHKTLDHKIPAITINPSLNNKLSILHLFLNKSFENWSSHVEKYDLLFRRSNKISQNPILHSKEKISLTSMFDLMHLSKDQWNNRDINFLDKKLAYYIKTCCPIEYENSLDQLIIKLSLPEESNIAVIGDLHGNDSRLEDTLRFLQKNNYLDEQYQCNPSHYIIFLGDYVDRGTDSLKVLELLATLKLENKNQVFLLRGNHEDVISLEGLKYYSKFDNRYYNYRIRATNELVLNTFFQKLPSSLLVGSGDDYVLFSHAGVHLGTDLTPLMETNETILPIKDSSDFSDRIKTLLNEPGVSKQEKKWHQAAYHLNEISKDNISIEDIYWADLESSSKRKIISLESLKSYFTLCGRTKNLKCLVRGHEHMNKIHRHKDKTIAITLDPSDHNNQTILFMKTASKFRDWNNQFVTIKYKSLLLSQPVTHKPPKYFLPK